MDLPTLMNSAELTEEQKVQLAQMMQSLSSGGGLNIGNPSMSSKKSKQRVSAQERNDLLNQLLNIGKLGTGTGTGTGAGADVTEQPTIDELKKRMKTKRYQSQMLRTNTYGLKQKQLNQTKNSPKTQVQVPVPVPVSNPIDQDNTVTNTQTEPVNTTIESKETDVLAMGEALSKIISSDNTNEGENEDFDDFIV